MADISDKTPLVSQEEVLDEAGNACSSRFKRYAAIAVALGILLVSLTLWCVAGSNGCRHASHLPVGESAGDFAPVRFLSVGDWGRNGTYNQSLIAKQMGIVGQRLRVQFVSSTGDNFYEEGLPDVAAAQFTDSFSSIYGHQSLQVPWYAVLGNHDYYGNVLAQLHPSLALRDRRWNPFRSARMSLPLCPAAAGPAASCRDRVDLFLLDTTPLVREYRSRKKHQLDWRGLNSRNWTQQEQVQLQELEGWLSASQARWKLVVGHHPVFSYGHHGSQQELVERVLPLLKKYGVDVYMNGHDHNLQHIKMDDGPTHFITSGGGSKAWRAGSPSSAPGLRYLWPGQGFAAVEVALDSLRLTFYGVGETALYSTVLKKS